MNDVQIKDFCMSQEKHYRISYLLDGVFKSFYVRAQKMDNAEAWHWATVDAAYVETQFC
ncbi:hypothetical protein APX70_02313 [Pseudomonas syringae pv. maculicola]|uniref:Uncharacterized protein n=1 Tax=Pseudomonas syringae pv. maculicola TaxID=59511 RepID=A0A3M2ZVL8_PSEYM|nr:hypothetical protein APX70_02313 [Pseudomonas syringae pv. maculicola]